MSANDTAQKNSPPALKKTPNKQTNKMIWVQSYCNISFHSVKYLTNHLKSPNVHTALCEPQSQQHK